MTCNHDGAYDLYDDDGPLKCLYCPACGARRWNGRWYNAAEWAEFLNEKLDLLSKEEKK